MNKVTFLPRICCTLNGYNYWGFFLIMMLCSGNILRTTPISWEDCSSMALKLSAVHIFLRQKYRIKKNYNTIPFFQSPLNSRPRATLPVVYSVRNSFKGEIGPLGPQRFQLQIGSTHADSEYKYELQIVLRVLELWLHVMYKY